MARFAYSGSRRPRPDAPAEHHALYEKMEEAAVYSVMKLPPGSVVVHGGEPTGIDAAVGQAARELGLVEEVHLPDLAKHGGDFRAAAIARNSYVITVGEDGDARAWALPWSKGTYHAFGLAERAGVSRVLRRFLLEGGVQITRWPPGPPQRLRVKNASLRGYVGPGRIDVTRGTGTGAGLAFAPTTDILEPAIEQRHRAAALFKEAEKLRGKTGSLFASEQGVVDALMAEGWAIEDAAWEVYKPQFLGEMRISAGMTDQHPRWRQFEAEAWDRGVRPRRQAWADLLAGRLGAGYDDDGARLMVAVCFCSGVFLTKGHCHTAILREIWAKMGAEDGGEAKGPGVSHVLVRG